jgi:hypothetical protein
MSNNHEPHARHDRLLIASLAAGDLVGPDRDRATAQITACAECSTLHADLISIARATAALPPAVAPRDFTISRAKAAELRPGGWRRLVAAIGGSRPLMSRQLGIGLATIGLAGLLVSTLPGIPTGQQAGAAPAGAMPMAAGGSTEAQNAPPDETVSIAGEGGASPAPAAGTTDSALAAIPSQPVPGATRTQTDSNGGGVFGSNIGKSAAPAPTNGTMSYDAASGFARAPVPVAGQPLASTEPPPSADASRGLFIAGSALLFAIGIALLLIRRQVRRAAWG